MTSRDMATNTYPGYEGEGTMPQMRVHHEDYRGWHIDRVLQESRTLDEGRSREFLGFMPRLSREVLQKSAGSSYTLGRPRLLEEVRAWIDDLEDSR